MPNTGGIPSILIRGTPVAPLPTMSEMTSLGDLALGRSCLLATNITGVWASISFVHAVAECVMSTCYIKTYVYIMNLQNASLASCSLPMSDESTTNTTAFASR